MERVIKIGHLLLAVLLSTAIEAQVDISAVSLYRAGHTLYRIKFEEQADEIQYVGKSELVYPVNTLWGGIAFEYSRGVHWRGKDRNMRISMKGVTNLGDPYDEMTDRDWTGMKDDDALLIQEVLLEVSSTRSTPLLSGYSAMAAVCLDNFTFRNKPLAIELAYGYDSYRYDIKGISGWQLFADSTVGDPVKTEFNDLYHNTSVLSYQVAWHTLAVRFLRSLAYTSSLELEYNIELIPLAFAYDEDDHLLRGKKSNAFTFGMGLGAGTALRYAFHPRLELQGSASCRYVRTSGSSTQEWYRDEYYDEYYNVTAGTRIEDIDTWIISLTGSLEASLVFRF